MITYFFPSSSTIYSNHSPPLTTSTCGQVPAGPKEVRVLITWTPVLLCCAPSSTAPMLTRLLMYSGGLYSCSVFYLLKIGHDISAPWLFPAPALVPTLIVPSGEIQADHLPSPGLPPFFLLITSLSVDLGVLRHYNAMASCDVIVEAMCLEKPQSGGTSMRETFSQFLAVNCFTVFKNSPRYPSAPTTFPCGRFCYCRRIFHLMLVLVMLQIATL